MFIDLLIVAGLAYLGWSNWKSLEQLNVLSERLADLEEDVEELWSEDVESLLSDRG